jgi:D-alanyl-D-alanine dipeptidase
MAITTSIFGFINPQKTALPKGFVYLRDLVPNCEIDLRYYGTNNFVGRKIDGYQQPVCIITQDAALALLEASEEFEKRGYRIKIFDTYRPQRAVNHFSKWANNLDDTLTKQIYYPNVNKADLFKLQYIASKSGHSRGSTIDLTLIDAQGNPLEMGTTWDYFGPESWPSDTSISKLAFKNRHVLRSIMIASGFVPYHEEWWHFTLKNEPFPETYFDFVIE